MTARTCEVRDRKDRFTGVPHAATCESWHRCIAAARNDTTSRTFVLRCQTQLPMCLAELTQVRGGGAGLSHVTHQGVSSMNCGVAPVASRGQRRVSGVTGRRIVVPHASDTTVTRYSSTFSVVAPHCGGIVARIAAACPGRRVLCLRRSAPFGDLRERCSRVTRGCVKRERDFLGRIWEMLPPPRTFRARFRVLPRLSGVLRSPPRPLHRPPHA